MTSEIGRNLAEAGLISTIQWVKHTESTLAHPLREVWSAFKDMRRWYTEYDFEDVSGPAYQPGSGLLEGQVLKVKSPVGLPRAPHSADAAGPQYFIIKTIKVLLQKEIVVLLSGSAYDWRQFTAFYVWKMTEHAGQTTVFIDSYGNAELFNPLPKVECSEYEDNLIKNWHRSWSAALTNLKKVLGEISD